MRYALALVTVLACSRGREVHITVGDDAIDTVRALGGHVIERDGGLAIADLREDQLDGLGRLMHAEFHRCGGFMLHDTLDDARLALHPAAMRTPVEYTLDHADEVKAILPQLGRERILATIRELSAMPNRYYRSDEGAAASRWLRDRWRSFSPRTDVTVELVDHGYPQKSVIMTIPGTTRADEVVVIGGHLDSIAFGGLGKEAPGADDDASGIATLTEVAHVLLANGVRPARTIKFIAYAAEEVGLRGSLSIVRDFERDGVDVVGVLQLDMTNYQGSDRDIWLIRDFTSLAQNAFLGRLIDTYVGATWGTDVCGYACSDHASWYRAGIPASMPFESRFAESNRRIHTRDDTLEISRNNADHAVKFARLAAAYAVELAKVELGTTTASNTPVLSRALR
jgi:leucyl aminopeptidase